MNPPKTPRQSKPQAEASEETFRLLFRDNPLPIWLYDLETLDLLDVNPAALEHYGYTRKEFLSMTLKDLHPSEDATSLLDHMAGRRAELKHSGEWRHKLKQGRIIDAQISSHAITYHGRKAAFVIAQDISERKRTEQLVRESEIRHRSLFSNMLEGFAYCRMIYDKDQPVDFEYLEVNAAFEKITGLKDVAGKMVTKVIPGIRESNPEVFEVYGRVAKTGHPERFVTYVKPLDIWFSLSVYSIQPGYFAAVFNDITEGKRAERTLQASEERYRALVTFSPDPLYVHVDHRITLVNPAFCQLLGADDPSQLIGKSIFEIVHRDHHKKVRDRLKLVFDGQPAPLLEEQFVRVDGTLVDVEVNAVGVDWQGTTGVQVIARDITERKRAEAELLFRNVILSTQQETSIDGILVVDEDANIVSYNHRFVEMWEVPTALVETKADKPLLEFITDKVKEPRSFLKRVEYLYKHKQETSRDEVVLTNGMIFDRYSAPMLGPDDRYYGRVWYFRDITEQKRADEVVKDSEERFRMVFEHVFDGISIYSEDPDPSKRRLIECNDQYASMAGRSREELLGLGNTQSIQKTLEATANTNRLASLPMGTAYSGTFSWIRPDGKNNVIEYVGVPITWRGQSYSIGIDRDITERKKAERDLKLMAQTVASARDCISITDLDETFIFVNDAFCTTYGYAPDELLGKDVSLLRSPHTPKAITDRIDHGASGEGWHGEIFNRRKDGTEFPVELWISAVRDDAGTPVALVGVARNITDRKATEDRLQQNQEQFRLIAENVADMIAVLDLDGKRIYNSPSYKNILGNTEALKGTDGFQEIHPDDVARVRKVFQETVRTGIGQRIEYRFLLRDGSICNIDSRGSVIRDSTGKISQVLVVSRDVTEEKRLASQFLRAQRMESIGTLAGGIAHDLNNILAPIMMAIEILRSKIPDAGGQRILNTIEVSAKRGSDIVRQVLAFGRGVQGERILVQLKHVINEVVKIAGQTFPKSIEITTGISRDLWTVSADPTQMHQVLLNMLVNARDAMPRGGALSISAENATLDEVYSRMHFEAKPGAYVCITIADSGTGIPAAIRERIFEPFFTTKDMGMGTGLGLSTTLAIVKSHGGFIKLDSEEGKGTTFGIYIPATGTTKAAAGTPEDVDLPTGNGELILIIDDEVAIREITKETLLTYGYKTLTASDGAEGVAVFAEHKTDIKLVITDIMMPVMDGTAAILALRKINPDVKIIAASGLTTKGQIATPPDSNVQAFLTKPYTAENLLKALAAALK